VAVGDAPRAVRAPSDGPGCGQTPSWGGIPPLGLHTGPPIGETGSFARGHGHISLQGDTVSARAPAAR
jgi:hypothetical protein